MARAVIKETQAVLCVSMALGHHQGRTLRFHSEYTRLVNEPAMMAQQDQKIIILVCVCMFLFLCMFNTGNRAGCDDRYGEFKPPAEWRDVHRRGRSCLSATHFHLSGCHALSLYDQVQDPL